jgi:wobble nucleotide-excising tRNase
LDTLKFDPTIVTVALDQEIEAIKKELEKANQVRLDRIRTVEDCISNITNLLINQPPKVKELSDYLSLPD